MMQAGNEPERKGSGPMQPSPLPAIPASEHSASTAQNGLSDTSENNPASSLTASFVMEGAINTSKDSKTKEEKGEDDIDTNSKCEVAGESEYKTENVTKNSTDTMPSAPPPPPSTSREDDTCKVCYNARIDCVFIRCGMDMHTFFLVSCKTLQLL